MTSRGVVKYTCFKARKFRHQIILEIRVDIDVLIPWKTVSSQVVSEVLVAETVIVGSVPKIYLNG